MREWCFQNSINFLEPLKLLKNVINIFRLTLHGTQLVKISQDAQNFKEPLMTYLGAVLTGASNRCRNTLVYGILQAEEHF